MKKETGHDGKPAQSCRGRLTITGFHSYHAVLMSTSLPDAVDVVRMVSGRRSFEGELPLARFARLRESLVGSDGQCQYRLEFGTDALGIQFLQINAAATVMLQCQRTLETFPLALVVEQRLGFIRREADEAGLPDNYEPMLLPDDRQLHLADLIEDELILALPLVPTRDDGEQVDSVEDAVVFSTGEEKTDDSNTASSRQAFAALAALKKTPS